VFFQHLHHGLFDTDEVTAPIALDASFAALSGPLGVFSSFLAGATSLVFYVSFDAAVSLTCARPSTSAGFVRSFPAVGGKFFPVQSDYFKTAAFAVSELRVPVTEFVGEWGPA
jgi:hypothetical protein